jgi:hypothetical protein
MGITSTVIPRVFDRICRFDRRSRKYPIRAILSPSVKPRSYTWRCDVQLDQGSEGACTGFGTAHEATARPVVVKGINNDMARMVYYRARQLDQWPGEDYEGSSVLGAVTAAVELGWYTEYRWAFGEADLALAVGYKGPAILGVNWYEGMSAPDKDGVIHVTGRLSGGHCIVCIGYNHKRRMYLLQNSWGKKWGVNGRCWIAASDMALLLARRGEACIPVKRAYGKIGKGVI